MTLKKTLIITLDDFVYDLYNCKKAIWKNVAKNHYLDISDHFIMAYYDAHLEKREKLGREYPNIAVYFNEVETEFIHLIESGNLSMNQEHIIYLKQWNEIYNLIFCTNLKLETMHKLLADTNFPLNSHVLVSSKHVLNAKPEADIYLKVARSLNIKPNLLTVIDLTLNGIQAAYLANTKGLFLAQFHEANSIIKKFAYAHFKKSDELNHYILNLINQNE